LKVPAAAVGDLNEGVLHLKPSFGTEEGFLREMAMDIYTVGL